MTRSRAFPVASWKTAKLELIPLPARKFERTVLPAPFGATRMTSTSSGGTICVCSLNTTENPWEKQSACPLRRFALISLQCSFWPASERRYSTTVPRLTASPRSLKSDTPSTQPSSTASFHPRPPFLCPTITFTPLSFRLRDCPCPCGPYPRTATVSLLRVFTAAARGYSARVTTSSFTPPKSMTAISLHSCWFFGVFRSSSRRESRGVGHPVPAEDSIRR